MLKYLTVDFIIQSKIKNVQALWILLIYRDRENGVTLFLLLSNCLLFTWDLKFTDSRSIKLTQ